MKPLTINELYKDCQKQIKKGNGDKVIMISSDDEGNSYHYLWYSFTDMKTMEEPVKLGSKVYECPFIFADENVASKNDTIILG
jgi:hypothetical protein